MNFNPAIQNSGRIAWDGANSFPRDVTGYNNFGFSFEVTTTLAADAVFKFQEAPASAGNPCVPGTFADINQIAICTAPAVGSIYTVTLPAGTVAGTVCAGSIPCRFGKFVQLVPVSGPTANVKAVMVLQGPHF